MFFVSAGRGEGGRGVEFIFCTFLLVLVLVRGESLLSECFHKYLAEMGDTLFSYKMPPANEGVVVCACAERM